MNQSLLCYHLEYLCGTAINFLVFLHNYCYTLLDYALTSQYLDSAVSTKVLFISLMQLVNGAQLLNVTCSFLSFACLAALSASDAVTVILL